MGEQMMIPNSNLPGHSVPEHAHPHEQIGMVYACKASLRIGGEERVVEKGDRYCIPGHTPHSDTCIGEEPFVMLDIFYSIREDLEAKHNQQGWPRDSRPAERPTRNVPATDLTSTQAFLPPQVEVVKTPVRRTGAQVHPMS
jgi:gentisate 1,2-dioxygenase